MAVRLNTLLSHFRAGKAGDVTAPVLTMPADIPDPRQECAGDETVYRLAARQYDPQHMTDADNRQLADFLYDAGAITLRDHDILFDGPGSFPAARSGTVARDHLTQWQARLARHMGTNNFCAVDSDSRALSILGRVVAERTVLH